MISEFDPIHAKNNYFENAINDPGAVVRAVASGPGFTCRGFR
jgi:hypothetical protein